MRRIALLLALSALALPLRAQDAPPSGFQALEVDRSTTCVDVLSRLETLDTQLEPLAARVQRLLGIAGAIQVEEASVVDSLQVSDPLEAAVAEWFRSDAALAQRYLAEQSQALLDERAASRGMIQQRLTEALEALQAQADSIIAPTGTLRTDGVACSGVILVRGPAVAACEGVTSRVCQAARDSTAASPFRFVDAADYIWDRQELRPWTAPTAIQATADGQLSGARTIGSTRVGNVAVSISFNPLLRARADLAPEQLAAFDSVNAALGVESTHPEVIFAPALSLQATLPRPLGDESHYVLHFGTIEAPDTLWTGVANTGAPIVGTIVLAPEHVTRLRSGEPLTLTAVRADAAGEPEAVYTIELTSLNQAARVEALLGYMSQQLSADLSRVIQPAN
ncbi:MAG: hypothetical protein OEO79_07645 [Gemmatimonadota bacterium]|nr:hypothetical protein [Gemmatimonadota bacterium]MDH3422822.1 hypothetical protein [Gemmatimonadota bacterium]